MTYWSFRLMIGLGLGAAALALGALWFTRQGRVMDKPWFATLAFIAIPTPFLAAAFGWIFTEMGRQPWIVFGLMATAAGVSQVTSTFQVWVSLIGFTLLYAVLAVIEVGLLVRTVKQGPPESVVDPFVDRELDAPLTISY